MSRRHALMFLLASISVPPSPCQYLILVIYAVVMWFVAFMADNCSQASPRSIARNPGIAPDGAIRLEVKVQFVCS
jgi:hypothetical protein